MQPRMAWSSLGSTKIALNSRSLASQVGVAGMHHQPHVFYSFIRKIYVNFIQYMANSHIPGNSFGEMLQNLQWESRKVNNLIFHSKLKLVFLPIRVYP